MNVFDCAIKIEDEARRFYLNMEAESSNRELKNLFSILAAAEEEQLRTLRMMKNGSGKEGDVAVEPEACAFRPLREKSNIGAAIRNDRDFYRHAIREGEQDIRFYEDLAARAKDERVRQKLLTVAEKEREHLARVENIYDFVEGPRSYLAWSEFSNLHEL